jgi:hypothetical protein
MSGRRAAGSSHGKLVSLFQHPEFVRRSQARAERELAEQIAPEAPCPLRADPPEQDAIEAFLDQLLHQK